jgi:hypothetical protein
MSFVGDVLPIYQRLTALLRDPNMPVTILTRSRVVAAPARDHGYNILDKKLKGFGVRIEPNGRKFWFLQTTKNGRRYYRSLGAFPAVPIDTAHQTARNLLGQIPRYFPASNNAETPLAKPPHDIGRQCRQYKWERRLRE